MSANTHTTFLYKIKMAQLIPFTVGQKENILLMQHDGRKIIENDTEYVRQKWSELDAGIERPNNGHAVEVVRLARHTFLEEQRKMPFLTLNKKTKLHELREKLIHNAAVKIAYYNNFEIPNVNRRRIEFYR